MPSSGIIPVVEDILRTNFLVLSLERLGLMYLAKLRQLLCAAKTDTQRIYPDTRRIVTFF